jgi:hypothetical protein
MEAPSLVFLDVFSVGIGELGQEKAIIWKRLSIVVFTLARRH